MKNLLVIGKTFPEPNTTAAGGRMMNLLKFFIELQYKITFVSTAQSSKHSADLKSLGIAQQNVQVNDAGFDDFILDLQPEIVLYDRFNTEEQFGWRVREHAPKALTILDTEDLHFLRKARGKAHNQNQDFTKEYLYTEDTKRELASIWRCDLTLIISEYEMDLLEKEFDLPPAKLFYLPLTVSNQQIAELLALENLERKDFITAGNFYHAPNLDAVIFLKEEIWPLIRKALPKTNLHIYGAYAPQRIQEMHKPQEGFLVHGWAEDLNLAYRQSKVCLTPLRFGAGLKGKLMQAMLTQTPILTTPIGGEGLFGDFKVPGEIAASAADFAKAAVELYQSTELMEKNKFADILNHRFLEDNFYPSLKRKLKLLLEDLLKHRQAYFYGEILHHQSLQSTKYLSKWIEEKNKI